MNEFYRWIAIVTLLIFLNLASWMGMVYLDKKLKKADAILQRLEQKESKREKHRLDPKSDNSDGM